MARESQTTTRRSVTTDLTGSEGKASKGPEAKQKASTLAEAMAMQDEATKKQTDELAEQAEVEAEARREYEEEQRAAAAEAAEAAGAEGDATGTNAGTPTDTDGDGNPDTTVQHPSGKS